jgi:hypothetical protein
MAAVVALAFLAAALSGCGSPPPSTTAEPEDQATVVTEPGSLTSLSRNDQIRIEVETPLDQGWDVMAHSESVLHLVDKRFELRGEEGFTVLTFVGVSAGTTDVILGVAPPAPGDMSPETPPSETPPSEAPSSPSEMLTFSFKVR